MQGKPIRQRDMVRQLLTACGYNEVAVCSGYAKAERDGVVLRRGNTRNRSPQEYAAVLWRDGHRAHSDDGRQRNGPWIIEYCKKHGIKI
jgi:hypothetical protein